MRLTRGSCRQASGLRTTILTWQKQVNDTMMQEIKGVK